MNIFIVKINEMTDNAWNFAEEISDEDRILFIPDTNGNIPYYVYSKLNSLSVAPEFFPVSSKDTLQNIVFSLALACCDADGTVYICSDDKIFAPLKMEAALKQEMVVQLLLLPVQTWKILILQKIQKKILSRMN